MISGTVIIKVKDRLNEDLKYLCKDKGNVFQNVCKKMKFIKLEQN